MIKHYEIRGRLKKAYANNRYLNNITIFRFHDYINEQEKKDELLESYRNFMNCLEIFIENDVHKDYKPADYMIIDDIKPDALKYLRQIKALEEGLK